jgi:FkbM family methyltransferase
MPPKSRLRNAAKTVLGRALPGSAYRWVLAGSVARDIRSGALSEPELALLADAVEAGDTAIDVGANHGMWTHALSKAVGPGGRVYAFEPIPYTADTLAAVMRILGLSNVTLVRKGCGERAATRAFSVPVQGSGVTDAALAHLSTRADASDSPVREVEAEIVALDDLLGELPEVSLLKVDVEGAEPYALAGASALLERDAPTVVAELAPELLGGFGFSSQDVIGFLTERGYSALSYERGLLRPLRDERPPGNAVFVHPRRADRLAGLVERG